MFLQLRGIVGRVELDLFALLRRAVETVENVGGVEKIVDVRAGLNAGDDRGAESKVLGKTHIVDFELRSSRPELPVFIGKQFVPAAILQTDTALVAEEVDEPLVMVDILRPGAGKVDTVLIHTDQTRNVFFDVTDGFFSGLARNGRPDFFAGMVIFVIFSDLEIGARGRRERLRVA